MSTRCQVSVECRRAEFKGLVTLYHHFDGYPTNMLPFIKKAYDMKVEDWKKGIPGRVASLLCAADPAGFEVENENALHSDIEWFYALDLFETEGSALWNVRVYQPMRGFWDKPILANMKCVFEGGILEAADRAEEIEKEESFDDA
jgi:hypothetical protein